VEEVERVCFLVQRAEIEMAAVARGTGTAPAKETDKKVELMKEVRSTSPPCIRCSSASFMRSGFLR
jgi:hypothetical protein